MTEPALVLVCKRPSFGIGKQRLSPLLSPHGAQRVAAALLECALEDCRSWPGPVVISPARPEDCSWAESLLKGTHVIPQGEGNLGQRINTLDQRLRDDGYARIVYMGSDAPALQERDYEDVRNALGHHDVVLSPSTDGGVVLMASRIPWPNLSSLPWSTADLGAALQDRCQSKGMNVAILSTGFDIDLPADLARGILALEGDSRPARQAFRHLVCQLAKTVPLRTEPGLEETDLVHKALSWNH